MNVDPKRGAVDLVRAVNSYQPNDVARVLNRMAPAELAAVAVCLARSVRPRPTATNPALDKAVGTTHERVARAVRASADYFGVSVSEVRGRGRTREIACARLTGYYVSVKALGVSQTATGRALGRTPSTVAHGVAQVTTDPDLLAHASAIALGLNPIPKVA